MVILAGGKGTRIEAVAVGRPKSALEVAGRPFIAHQLDLIARCGCRDVLLCVGVGADAIREFVKDGSQWGLRVAYSREQPGRLLGTGGAIANALPLLDPRFGVMYGDSYLDVDYGKIFRVFEKSGMPALMCVFRNRGRWDASNTRIKAGLVTWYSKATKPGAADYIDYGLTFFQKQVFARRSPAGRAFDLAAVMARLVRSKQMAAYEVKRRFYEIGKPEGLAELDAFLSARRGKRKALEAAKKTPSR